MAKYILVFGTDRPLGSLGGTTFQRCGQVFAMRKRNVPVQKRSAKQSIAKNTFDSIQKNYKTLTVGNHAQWLSEVPNYPRLDSLGNPYNISASNLQASSNINLVNASQSTLAQPAAPSAIAVPTFASYATNGTLTIFQLFFTVQIVPAGFTYNIYMSTPQQQEGAQQDQAQQKLVHIFQPGVDSHSNFANAVKAAFDNAVNPSISQYFWLRAVQTQINTGQQGSSQTSYLNF